MEIFMMSARSVVNIKKSSTKILGSMLLGVLLLVLPPKAIAERALDFSTGEIELLGTVVGRSLIAVEFARTKSEHRRGLMYREKLTPGTGMLFIYEAEAIRSFWMKNTLIALDIIFFDGEGHFVSAQYDVPPLTLVARRSGAPAQYVLELNAGEAAALGISPQTVLILPNGPRE